MTVCADYPPRSTARGAMVGAVRDCIGLPYRWGGNSPADGGLDCSGLVQWGLYVAGAEPWASLYPGKLDYAARSLWAGLAPIGQDEHALPGDIAFYGRRAADGEVIAVTHCVVVARVGVGGEVQEVIGASKGYRGLVDPAEARRRGAVVRSFVQADAGGRGAEMYRDDWLGFRRFPDDRRSTT